MVSGSLKMLSMWFQGCFRGFQDVLDLGGLRGFHRPCKEVPRAFQMGSKTFQSVLDGYWGISKLFPNILGCSQIGFRDASEE